VIPAQLRLRQTSDIDGCVHALAQVHQADGYPSNWPADPVRWLTPADVLQAWVAVADQATILGHVMLRQVNSAGAGRAVGAVSRLFVVPRVQGQGLAAGLLRRSVRWATGQGMSLVLEVDHSRRTAIRLYERAGWRRTHSTRAEWTTTDGKPVTLYHYTTEEHPDQDLRDTL
jgi:GNAT superfamily N-acetyltransferase